MFYGFSAVRIKEGVFANAVRTLGGLCFGVYLLHENIDLRRLSYGWIRGVINPGAGEGVLFFLWELICCTVILFGAGIFVEWVRTRLSGIVFKRVVKKTKIYLWLKELDEKFA